MSELGEYCDQIEDEKKNYGFTGNGNFTEPGKW